MSLQAYTDTQELQATEPKKQQKIVWRHAAWEEEARLPNTTVITHNHYEKNYTEFLDEVIGLRNFTECKREKIHFKQ